ncbi:MAG: type II secretion system GspH family protein [Bdellovibrionaceae bacterium]|nr:type II secretion system GspH family protein [Pseudobdellovibrionaceae bacterium]MDW8190800.1 type II secretion system protein [Pseudobdellovibrionaceae bacterium]
MKCRKKLGFTLLETLIAVVILAGGLYAIGIAWSGALARLNKIKINYEMSRLLEEKMGEIEFEYRNQSIQQIPEELTGDFGSDMPNYSWRLTSKKMEFPDLSNFFRGQEGEIDQITLMVAQQIQRILNQSVKEVTVTVISRQSPNLTQSVTTLFVEPNLGPGNNNPSRSR